MDDQRHVGNRLDGGERVQVDLGRLGLLQVHVADRYGHGIDAGLAGEARRVFGVRAGRGLTLVVADETDLALRGDAGGAGHLGDGRRLVDVLRQRFPGAVIHHRGKAAIDGLATVVGLIAVIEMGDHRHRGALGQGPEHGAENAEWRVLPAAGAGLQDHRRIFRFGRGNEGASVLPSEDDQAADRITLLERRLQDVGERGQAHLNLATMSMMPGMVFS